MTALDFAILAAYLLAIIGIAVLAWIVQRRLPNSSEGSHYFLANANLTWPVIGLAMFAANISTVQLVSLAQSAYSHGLVYGNFEWMAGFTLVALSLFFAPVYIRLRLPTIPEFFERRYNRLCRDLLTIISLFSAIVIHIGVALFTAATVLQNLLQLPHGAKILGVSPGFFLIVTLGIATGVYTLVGGLLAVVWTESFQTILLLVGAIAITVSAWHLVGGLQPLIHTLQQSPHPLVGTAAQARSFNPSTSRFLTMLRPSGDPSGLPWYSILLGYQVLAVWYWCTDQTIVQRILAAKDLEQAQLGSLFCAWLKILPVFFFVLPGVMCVALVQQGAFGGASPGDPVNTYTFMVTHLLPTGLRGLVAAALVAAAMQTCSAALNSIATLVSYDLVRARRPRITEHDLVRIGRATTAAATLIAIALSPVFGHYSSIIEGLNKLISYAAPPITAVVLGGIFTRWATARAAAVTLIFGMCGGIAAFLLDWFNIYKPDYMLSTFISCAVCFLVLYLVSKQQPQTLSVLAEACIWRRTDLHAGPRSMLVPAAGVLCVFAALYALIW